MSRVNETRSLVEHDLCECNCVICNSKQNQNDDDVAASVKNQMIGVLVKMIYKDAECGIMSVIGHVKLTNIFIY